jgi:YD repeat-containing protein
MARIPEDVLQSLKREVSLERLVGASGVELQRQGLNLVGRCPWHEDNGPSLVVTPSKNHLLGEADRGRSSQSIRTTNGGRPSRGRRATTPSSSGAATPGTSSTSRALGTASASPSRLASPPDRSGSSTNAIGRLVRTVDALGKETLAAYDGEGLKTQQTFTP